MASLVEGAVEAVEEEEVGAAVDGVDESPLVTQLASKGQRVATSPPPQPPASHDAKSF